MRTFTGRLIEVLPDASGEARGVVHPRQVELFMDIGAMEVQLDVVLWRSK